MKIGIVVTSMLLVLISSTAGAELSRRVFVQDEAGTRVLREAMPGDDATVACEQRDELLWQRTIPGNIYASCAAMNGSVFAGSENGTACPAEYFDSSSDGTPTWIFSGGVNQVHARAGLLALVEAVPAINGVRVHVWQEGATPTELWTKDIADCNAPRGCIRLCEAGDVLGVAVNRTANCTVYALDAMTGALLSSFDTGASQFARALRMSADGSLAALRAGATLYVIETATGTQRWTGNVGASADPLAFSPDGQWIASGWISIYVYHWDGSNYALQWTNNGGGAWYLGTCAMADNGQLVAGWYTTSYNQNKIMWFDASSSTPTWTYLFPISSGGNQDLPVASATNGYAAAIGSWGDASGTNAEINVFLASGPDPIFAVNTPGSIYDLDIDPYALPGGRFPLRLTACGKHVHANEFGSGGDLYCADVSGPTAAPDTPAPAALSLSAYPNPFNPHSTLTLELRQAGWARLAIYAADGRRVCSLLEGEQAAGRQSLVWDGRDAEGHKAASGVYLARAETARSAAITRLVLLR